MAALRQRGVAPLAAGEVIVATREPHETAVLAAIRELGLELQVIFNKGAVMVLPAGVNKATGLLAALEELKISPHNVVGVGDAENDHSFLKICERSAAVARRVARDPRGRRHPVARRCRQPACASSARSSWTAISRRHDRRADQQLTFGVDERKHAGDARTV